MPSPTIHRLRLLLVALLFSTGGAAIKATALSNWQVACFRSGLAAVALLILMPAWRRGWNWRTLLVGAAYASTMVLYVSGNKLTTAANTIFLQSTAPLYLMLLGPWLLRERLRAADLLLAGLLGAGMGMFFLGSEPARATAPDPATGNLLGALAGFTWALTILGLRWLGRDARPGEDPGGAAVASGNWIVFLVCLPFVFPFAGATSTDLLIVGYLGLFQIGVAYMLLTRAVRHVPVVETSLLLLLEPVLAAFWAWLVHDERPGPWSFAGCLLILGATIGAAVLPRRKSETT